MFLENKYTNLYYSIITNCQTSNGEVHHIIPKALGGSNDKDNLVTVSPKAHFILHRLLIKMVKQQSHKTAMNYALFMMMNRNISNYSSKTYEASKIVVSESMKQNNPMHRKDVLDKRIGQKRSAETKKRLSEGTKRVWNTVRKRRPLREFNCPVCSTFISSRIPTKTTCSKKCSATLQHNKYDFSVAK